MVQFRYYLLSFFKILLFANKLHIGLHIYSAQTMETLPPTQDALLQHVRRIAYQSGIWCTSDQSEQHVPTAEDWGWTFYADNQSWIPVWNILPVASKACSGLVTCSCKSHTGCGGRCTCKKASWNCTELCTCVSNTCPIFRGDDYTTHVGHSVRRFIDTRYVKIFVTCSLTCTMLGDGYN